ncbi:SIMPL domain-containing protein [Parachitinimonas caeni]|uniref:SIMPL domain-containing protein n=1 Tax=Parachitinimonas caeni TaxID=3031301 RepID=A0ABT7E481_9NEIS|nr:SIMPL domain-containing protein [Parachitinimonas caeni]MDK2127064.1 SIMPL domain-containing protein [Parachitinimonas caeni]
MDRFIEVVGTASLVESVVEYRADVTVQVRAAQVETAIKEVGELRAECIRQLRQSGLNGDELSEGGAEVWRPWFWKQKPGKEASHKLLICSHDMNRLMTALGALEPLFENQRHALSVSMRAPRFDVSIDARRAAERAALADAETKAKNIAECVGLKINSVLEVEELGVKTYRSGTYGDEDWMGVYAGGASAAALDAGDAPEHATRSSTVRFRVRFATGA